MEYIKLTYVLSWLFVIRRSCLGSEIELFMAGNNGEIRSPNYPQDYPLNFSCTWTIQTAKGKKIRLQFLDFNVEKAKRCIYDFVQIRDRRNIKWTSKNVLKLCGNELPSNFISRGRFLQVRFRSDKHNLVERGFLAKWKAEGNERENTKVCTTMFTYITKSVSHPCPSASSITVTKRASCPIRNIKPTPCSCSKRTTIDTKTQKDNYTPQLPKQSPTTEKPKRDPTKAPVTPTLPSNRVDITSKNDQNVAEKSNGMREDKIIIIVFIAFVSLLLLINILLIFFLWKRNKQVGELRMISKSKSFQSKSEEYSGAPTPRRTNKNIYDYKAVPSTSSSSNGTTLKSVNKYIERILRSGRYDTADSSVSSQPNTNQEKFLSMLTDVIRPTDVDLHSLSSDTNDGDVSDEYVSTELSDHITPFSTVTK